MKRTLALAALGATILIGSMPAIAADVGVSISVGQPGYYGRIDIGNHAPPQVVYRQPVVVQAAPYHAGPPAYLRVPPGHARHWSRHCGRYGACGVPVYFVQDQWYRQTYAPRYLREHDLRGYHYDQGRGAHEDARRRGRGGDHGHGGRGRGRD